MLHTLRRHPREWSPTAWFIVVGGLLLGGVLVALGVQPPGVLSPSNAQLVAEPDISQNLDVNYPILHIENIDAQLKAFAEKQTDKFTRTIKDKRSDPRNKLTLSYTIPHFGEETISVVFTATKEMIDKKPVMTHYRLVFDVASGKKLAFGDLFNDTNGVRQVLADILYDYFSVNQEMHLSSAQQIDLLNFELSDVRDFLVYEDSIVLYCNPANLAKKAASKSVQIQKTVIHPLLKDSYSQNDVGRKLDALPEGVDFAIAALPARHTPNANSGKKIALTFDDGPSEYTPQLLDALARYRSKATFYVLGHLAQPYAGHLQRMVKEGHEIGNHTWLHPNLTLLNGEQIDQQVGDTQRAIQQATGGYTPRTLRPPYGAVDAEVVEKARANELEIVMWNVDPNDWQVKDSQTIHDHIMSAVASGQVILLHDIYGSSVDAAIRIIPELLKQGYQLVTVSDL